MVIIYLSDTNPQDSYYRGAYVIYRGLCTDNSKNTIKFIF